MPIDDQQALHLPCYPVNYKYQRCQLGKGTRDTLSSEETHQLTSAAMKYSIVLAITIAVVATLASAESECEKQKKKEATNTSPLKLDVKCLPNGDYAPLQCFPSTKFCYCATPDGNQITQPSRNRKFCSCDLKKHEVTKKLSVNGRPIDRKYLTIVSVCLYLTTATYLSPTQLPRVPGCPSASAMVCTTRSNARRAPTSAGASTRMASRSARKRRWASPVPKHHSLVAQFPAESCLSRNVTTPLLSLPKIEMSMTFTKISKNAYK